MVDTRTSAGGTLVCHALNNDFNVALINTAITGDVSVNDIVSGGRTYGAPIANNGNPDGATISMNTDGTYSFKSSATGIFNYTLPVCAAGQESGCEITTLQIIVNNPTTAINKPILNPDMAIVLGNPAVTLPITVNVKANDGPGNSDGVLGMPTIYVPPAHGNATIDGNGNIVYQPAPGYYGSDILVYQICEPQNGSNCGVTTLSLTVVAPSVTTLLTAADDYTSTTGIAHISGNVLVNDKGTGLLSVTATGTKSIPGKGTLTIATNGNYTFTPTAGFSGTVDFVYSATDITSLIGAASLHVLVKPFDLHPDFNVTTKSILVSGNVSTNDLVPIYTIYGTPVALQTNPTTTIPVVTGTGAYTFTESTPGIYTFNIPVCSSEMSSGCPAAPLTITVNDPAIFSNPPIANADIVLVMGDPTAPVSISVNVKANDGPGNLGGTLGIPIIVMAPAHGTAIVDGSGEVIYTPTPDFYGTDLLTYQICEPQGSGNCNTATLTVTIVAPDETRLLAAADDYASTKGTAPVSGNVLLNDIGTGVLSVMAAGTTTIAGKGVLVIATNGVYSFTPDAGFIGTADFVYTAVDASNTISTATLHVNVKSGGLNVQLKVYLEGAYRTSTGLMTNVLNAPGTDILSTYALANPYNTAFFGQDNGNEHVNPSFFTANTNIVDWVLLEIRSASDFRQVLAKRGAFVRQDGIVVEIDGSSAGVNFPEMPAGNYYVSVAHRNHLTVISANPLSLSATPTAYDFSTGLNKAMDNGNSNAMKQTGTTWSMWGGDYNHDQIVDQLDNSYLQAEVRQGYQDEYHLGDMYFDGFVDQIDKTAFFNFNKQQVPTSPLF